MARGHRRPRAGHFYGMHDRRWWKTTHWEGNGCPRPLPARVAIDYEERRINHIKGIMAGKTDMTQSILQKQIEAAEARVMVLTMGGDV